MPDCTPNHRATTLHAVTRMPGRGTPRPTVRGLLLAIALLVSGFGGHPRLNAVTISQRALAGSVTHLHRDTLPDRPLSRSELRALEREIRALELESAREERRRQRAGEAPEGPLDELAAAAAAYDREVEQAKSLGLAGFICSVSFLLTGLLGLVAGIVLSGIALSKMRRLGVPRRQRGLARAGLIVGIAVTGAIVGLLVVAIAFTF